MITDAILNIYIYASPVLNFPVYILSLACNRLQPPVTLDRIRALENEWMDGFLLAC